MDIECIKKAADEVSDGRNQSLKMFLELEQLAMECRNLWNNKIKEFTDKLWNDFKDYFKDNGYSVVEKDNNNTITAKYNNSIFVISQKNYEGEQMFLDNSDIGMHETFWVKPSFTEDYRYYKQTVQIDRIRVTQCIKADKSTDYVAFINKIKTVEQLDEFRKIIELNREHFTRGIEIAEKEKLFIHRMKYEKLYEDFYEFIKSI